MNALIIYREDVTCPGIVTLGGGLPALSPGHSPAHLKPGALSHHLGQVHLIEEVLIVRYPFTSLYNSTPTVKVVLDKLNNINNMINATQDREDKAPSKHQTQVILELLEDRVLFIKQKIEKLDIDYSLHPVHARKKRGLLDFVGKTSKYLFGTATNDDIRDLREHYNRLLSYAAQNGKVINLNCRKIKRLQAHFDKLLTHTNKLTTVVNIVLRGLKHLENFILMDQAVQVMERIIGAVLEVNEEVIRNMVDAVDNKVTTSLFPVHDLVEIINIAHLNFSFQPLYSPEMAQYYFPLLEASLTTEAIVIHVPFKSKEVFEAYEVAPFPFSVNNSLLTLDMPASLVLIAKDFSFYSACSSTELQLCKSSYPGQYHCSASHFTFLPIRGGVCEVALTQQNAAVSLSLCPYRHLSPVSVVHNHFHGHHYFFFVKPLYISVICPEGTNYQEVTGHYAVEDACHIKSGNITTYPSRVHLAFTANVTHRVFPLNTLLNLNFSRIAYVTNTLTTLSFANESEFADVLEESLPGYLYPTILYPSIIVPIVIIIIVLTLMYCCIRKVSVLHNYLNSQLKKG